MGITLLSSKLEEQIENTQFENTLGLLLSASYVQSWEEYQRLWCSDYRSNNTYELDTIYSTVPRPSIHNFTVPTGD